jgi:hypothetical protein
MSRIGDSTKERVYGIPSPVVGEGWGEGKTPSFILTTLNRQAQLIPVIHSHNPK